jgi:hypothetical protein
VLLPGMPALVALGLVGLDLAGERSRGIRIACALLLSAGLVSSVRATWLLSEQKQEAARVQAQIVAFPQSVVVTRSPYLGQQFATLWDQKQLLWSREPNLLSVIQGLQRSGVRQFLLLAEEPDLAVDWIHGVRCNAASRHRGRRIRLFDMDLQECEIRPLRARRRS